MNWPYFQTAYGYGVNADCFDAFSHVADGSINMVLCDLPYGTTQNKWDTVLPLDKLWLEYNRVCRGAVVLTAAQPFTSLLVTSNLSNFKYDWCWQKGGKPTGYLNAKKQPLRDKEDVLVFYRKQCCYNPQMIEGKPYSGVKRAGSNKQSDNYNTNGSFRNDNEGVRYPRQIIVFNRVEHPQHPTQKPIELMEYLIKTYTNEGDTVLDNTAGSMTTGVAAENLKRKWLCFERDPVYYEAAKARFNAV